jgi:hypothetical protein
MDRKNAFILGGAILLGFLVLGLTQALAQRYPPGPGGPVGRFQVARANADVIVLLDTTTGDLYSAQARDIQPYHARFRDNGRYEKKEGKKDDFPFEKKEKDFDLKKSPPIDKKGDFKEKFDEKKGDLEPDRLSKRKAEIARIWAYNLEKALRAYFVDHDSMYPKDLMDLTLKDENGGPYILAEGLLDPWGKAYSFDPAGPRNGGKKPDVFTRSPEGKLIGNWPEQKDFDDKKAPDLKKGDEKKSFDLKKAEK